MPSEHQKSHFTASSGPWPERYSVSLLYAFAPTAIVAASANIIVRTLLFIEKE
jgi:hypothetical protein